MGLKEDIKLQQERLRVENEIANRVERQTKSLSAYREGVKEVKENAKQIKRLDGDILQIEKDIAKEVAKKGKADKEAIKLGKEHVANLKQQRAQVVATNKELLNASNLMKAMGNSMISSFMGILPSLSDVINKVLELDDITRDTAASIGLSGAGFDAVKMSTEEARQSATRWGFELGTAVKMMGSFNEESGRAVILSTEASEKMLQVARATNMSGEEMGAMAGQMEAFGLGATQSAQVVADIQAMSEQMGANAGKVIKKFQANLGLLNKMNFRGGMKALAKMSAHSEKFKLSMEAVAGVSDKVFRPEGAIEASAQLQMMGGSLAQLGDPFKLMYQARNAPEELAKSITKAAKESATFNKETGEFEMSAHELDRMREAANALGMDYTDLVKTAKQASKMDYMEKFLPSGMDKKDKDLILGMSEMGKDGAEITFSRDGKIVTEKLMDLSVKDRQNIVKRAEEDKERAKQAMGVGKMWTSIQNALMLVAVEVMQPLVDFLGSGAGKAWMTGLTEALISFAKKMRDWWPEIKKGLKWVWEKLKWVGENWKEALIWSAIGFASYWVSQQLLAGYTFAKGARLGGLGKGGGGTDKVKDPVKGKPGGSLKSLAEGLGAMGTPQVLFGALNLIPTAVGMVAMVPAIPTIMLLGTVKMKALYANLSAIGRGLTKMGTPQALLGAGVLTAAAIGFTLMTAGILGLGAIALLGEAAAAGLSALGGGLLALGNMAMAPPVWVALAVIGLLTIAFIGFAFGILMIGQGIALVVGSFVELFSVVSIDNIGAIFLLGPALMLASLGIISLAGAIVIMGLALANPFGLLGLIGLATAAYSLGDAMKGVDADGITKAVDAVNSVNTENIEALKSLSMWLGMMGNTVKIEFGDINVDGEIDLVGGSGSKVSSELLKNTEFTNELKRIIAEHTHFDKKGGS
tara:strand:- start:17980 stop:20745 length:2766 start_codon:yes stop_codon:yes gene_type:complete